jgi:hypothetical protein
MVAVMVLVDYKPTARLWGLMRLVLGALRTPKMDGLKLFKVLGSGHDGGFGLKPSTTRQGLFCVFDHETQADAFLNASSLIAQYKLHAREFFATKLVAYSSRGSWSGSTISVGTDTPAPHAPIATLTRASIRPTKARAFWSESPPSEASLEKASGILLSTGLGEAPFFRQATFSIWENTEAMNQFARTGAHLQAIKAAHSGGYFSESMFVRFVPIGPQGIWKGRVFG